MTAGLGGCSGATFEHPFLVEVGCEMLGEAAMLMSGTAVTVGSGMWTLEASMDRGGKDPSSPGAVAGRSGAPRRAAASSLRWVSAAAESELDGRRQPARRSAQTRQLRAIGVRCCRPVRPRRRHGHLGRRHAARHEKLRRGAATNWLESSIRSRRNPLVCPLRRIFESTPAEYHVTPGKPALRSGPETPAGATRKLRSSRLGDGCSLAQHGCPSRRHPF